MKQPVQYPDPITVRMSPVRTLATLVPVAALAAGAISLAAGRAQPVALLASGFFGLGSGFLLVLTVLRPVQLRLTSRGLQYRRLFCAWDQVLGVRAFGTSGPYTWLSFVMIDYREEPSGSGTAPAGLRTIQLPTGLVMNRRRLAALVADYRNAWAADHGQPAIPSQPGRAPASGPGSGASADGLAGAPTTLDRPGAWQDLQAAGLSLRVPAGWTVPPGGPEQTAWSATGVEQDGVSPRVTLTRQDVNEDLDQWSQAVVAAQRESRPSYQLLDVDTDRIDDHPAVVRLAAFVADEHPLTSLEWSWLDGGTGLTLTTTCASSRFAELEAVFTRTAHSVSGGDRTREEQRSDGR